MTLSKIQNRRPRSRIPRWIVVVVIVYVLTGLLITASQLGVAPGDVVKFIYAVAALVMALGAVAWRRQVSRAA